MDYKLLLIVVLGIAALTSFIHAIVTGTASNKLLSENAGLQNDLDSSKEVIKTKNENLIKSANTIADLEDQVLRVRKQLTETEEKFQSVSLENASLQIQIENNLTEIAELKGKIEVLNRTNSTLLKEVADDVTVNVKAADDVKMVVENPKNRRSNKRKKHGGSTTNNNQAPKNK